MFSQISPIIDSLSNLLKTFGEQVSSILESAGSVVESFGSAIRNVLDGVAGIFDSIGNAAKNAGQGVKLMAEGIQILVNMNLADLVATLGAASIGLGKMASNAEGMVNLGIALHQIATSMTTFATSSALALNAIANFTSQVGTLQSSLGSIPGLIAVASTSLSGISAGTQAVASAFSIMISRVQASMQTMLTTILIAGTQMMTQGRLIGQQTTMNITIGILGGVPQVSSAMSSLVRTAQSVGMSGVGVMRYVGNMIGQGLAQGMYSALGAVTAAANALVAQAERAAQAKAKINSPSHLFRDNVGRYIAQGGCQLVSWQMLTR